MLHRKCSFKLFVQVHTDSHLHSEIFERIKGDLQQQGYSEVIDIWSVGCITATLLTNDLIFPGDESQYDDIRNGRTVDELEKLWNTSIMDHGQNWIGVRSRPKAFIRDCLVVDENKRMTAKQALHHPWLTDRSYAPIIEKVYNQAIKGWKPQQKNSNPVDFIDTTNVVPTASRPEHVKRLAEEVKSRHFQNSPSAPSLMALLSPSATHVPPQKRKRTPLPQIADDADSEKVEVPASPSVTQLRGILASPLRPPEITQLSNVVADDAMVHCSVEDFAPPWVGPASRRAETYPHPYFNDSPTQSQMLLGDLSIPDSGFEDGSQS